MNFLFVQSDALGATKQFGTAAQHGDLHFFRRCTREELLFGFACLLNQFGEAGRIEFLL